MKIKKDQFGKPYKKRCEKWKSFKRVERKKTLT